MRYQLFKTEFRIHAGLIHDYIHYLNISKAFCKLKCISLSFPEITASLRIRTTHNQTGLHSTSVGLFSVHCAPHSTHFRGRCYPNSPRRARSMTSRPIATVSTGTRRYSGISWTRTGMEAISIFRTPSVGLLCR